LQQLAATTPACIKLPVGGSLTTQLTDFTFSQYNIRGGFKATVLEQFADDVRFENPFRVPTGGGAEVTATYNYAGVYPFYIYLDDAIPRLATVYVGNLDCQDEPAPFVHLVPRVIHITMMLTFLDTICCRKEVFVVLHGHQEPAEAELAAAQNAVSINFGATSTTATYITEFQNFARWLRVMVIGVNNFESQAREMRSKLYIPAKIHQDTGFYAAIEITTAPYVRHLLTCSH
jgi:hypothetical protein